MNPHAQMQDLKDKEKLLESQVEEAQHNLEAVQSELDEIQNQWLSIRNTLVLERFRTVSDDFVEVKTISKDKRRWQHKTLTRLSFYEGDEWNCYLVKNPQKYINTFSVLELAYEAAKTETEEDFLKFYRLDTQLSSDGTIEFKESLQSESCHA